MQTGRPKTELLVTADERHTLEQWARRPNTAQALARRANHMGTLARPDGTEREQEGSGSGAESEPLVDTSAVCTPRLCVRG